MVLEPITDNDQHKVTWDKEENMQAIRERLNVLLKGCKCVTGCKNRVCGCRKKDIKCSEGCQCTNCENYGLPPQDREDLANVALQETAQSSSTSDEEHTDEFVFAAANNDSNVHAELQ